LRSASVLVPVLSLYFGVAAATPAAAPASGAAAAATQPAVPKAAGGKKAAKHAGPEYFHVNVSLSSQIVGFLQQRKETVVVSADYYGRPAKGAEKLADAMGEVQLGEERVEKTDPGKAIFTGTPINKRKLQYVKDGDVQVLINVYSGRHSSPDNLLSCGFFEGPVSAVLKYDLTLTCKLLDDPK